MLVDVAGQAPGEPAEGRGRGPACTCHRCLGDGPLPARSAGPLSGAHRTCHTPDGRVLSKSVIGGQSEGMRRPGRHLFLGLRAPGGH